MFMKFSWTMPKQIFWVFSFSALLLIAAQGHSQQPTASPWQPRIHFSAPPDWINDPNGPILLHGQYNLYFQFTPRETNGDT